MTAYLVLLVDYTVWEVQADDADHAISQFRRDMPRQRTRHRGVFAQVVPPHRMNTEPEPVELAAVTGAESCPCCLHGIRHNASLVGRTCKTCGHIAYVHRNNNGGTDDRSNPEPG